MDDLDKRLEEAVKKRDTLAAEAQRIEGRKQAAEKALEEIRKEILEKKLDPDTLSETITNLEASYKEAVIKFEADVEAARVSLTPYQERITP